MRHPPPARRGRRTDERTGGRPADGRYGVSGVKVSVNSDADGYDVSDGFAMDKFRSVLNQDATLTRVGDRRRMLSLIDVKLF